MMRRNLVVALSLLVAITTMAPVVEAQAPPAPPVPKITITGFIDAMTTYSRNVSNADGLFNRQDKQWYARSRGRFDIIGQVGEVKAVFGFELDEVYGQAGSANSTIVNGAATSTSTPPLAGGTQFGTDGSFGLNTDVRGQLEVKWMYIEFPAPLAPLPTIVRIGAQPFATAASYKLATYANGDFPGVNLYTTITPGLKIQGTYVAVEENLLGTGTKTGLAGPLGYTGATANSQNRGDDFAAIVSPEFTPFKGLDIKPVISLFHAAGTTSASSRQGRGGLNTTTNFTNPDGTSHGGINEDRITVGVDARYRMGPFSLDPSIYYQFGSRNVVNATTNAAFADSGALANHKYKADIDAWLLDLRGGFQLGPLLLQGLAVYSTGNTARNNTLGKVRYYQPLDTDTSYLADWGTQLTSLGLDYANALNEGGARMAYSGTAIGWDKYGRAQLGAKATYALTPALSMMAGVNGHWTAEAVQKYGTANAGSGITPVFAYRGNTPKDDSRYVGTEFMGLVTWNFAPGLTWYNAAGYMIMGPAMDAVSDPTAGPRNAIDGFIYTSKFVLSF